jgi:hypothetical protein
MPPPPPAPLELSPPASGAPAEGEAPPSGRAVGERESVGLGVLEGGAPPESDAAGGALAAEGEIVPALDAEAPADNEGVGEVLSVLLADTAEGAPAIREGVEEVVSEGVGEAVSALLADSAAVEGE